MNGCNQPGVLIGAFDRDNFGDLLFLSVTRRCLLSVPAVAAAPFARDMSHLGGERTVPYQEEFLRGEIPFVWVVGGEVGAVSFRAASKMSGASEGAVVILPRTGSAPSPGRNLAGWDAVAYLPRLSLYPGTLGARLVINSAGLTGLRALTGVTRIEAVTAVREATYVSVRDRSSSDVLHSLGIAHTLEPDVVHMMRSMFEGPRRSNEDLALVQLSAHLIERAGVSRLTAALEDCKALRGRRVRLFSAGEAPGHDSMELLGRVFERAQSGGLRGRIDVSAARTPMEKVSEIADAGLWIGSSLHGFILATCFETPRVGLALRKLETYANTWGIVAPTSVPLRDLDEAIESAVRSSRSGDCERVAAVLEARAESNARAALEHVLSSRPSREELISMREESHAFAAGEHRRRTVLKGAQEAVGLGWSRAVRLWGRSRMARATRRGRRI